jgi:hypothetical protein
MPDFSIPVREYDCTPNKPGLGVPRTPFPVNDQQLVVCIARSILTGRATRSSRRFMAAIVRPTLDFMLDWASAPALKLRHDFGKTVKDFSAKSSVGELAQGICYAYWMIGRGYIWVTDFDSWAVDTGVTIPSSSKRPDYVMFDPASGETVLMEAKGTSSGDHKKAMGEALRQCRAVLEGVYADKGFGCALTLDVDSATGRGCLHLRDPEGVTEGSDRTNYLIFRSSYSSWFEISGDRERAAYFRNAKTIGVNRQIPNQTNDFKKADRGDPLRSAIARALGINPERARFRVDEEVWDALHSEGVYSKMDLGGLASRLKEKGKRDSNAVIFPDGTIISQY